MRERAEERSVKGDTLKSNFCLADSVNGRLFMKSVLFAAYGRL